jgi:hypothetical protein
MRIRCTTLDENSFSEELRNELVEELIPNLVGESRTELDAPLTRDGRNRGMEGEQRQKMREIEEELGKEAMRLHPEKHACPRRRNPKAAEAVLSRDQAERGGKAECPAEQFDRHPARCWGTRIASQPLLKVETIMRALRTGKRRRRGVRALSVSLLHLHLEVLAA